jgi:hypothetical protein
VESLSWYFKPHITYGAVRLTVRRSPKNLRISFNHAGLTHFAGIHLLQALPCEATGKHLGSTREATEITGRERERIMGKGGEKLPPSTAQHSPEIIPPPRPGSTTSACESNRGASSQIMLAKIRTGDHVSWIKVTLDSQAACPFCARDPAFQRGV